MTFIKTAFILCLMALPLSIVADDFERGDCNQDGSVNISDVTSLINYLLNSQWPSEVNDMTYTVNGVQFKMVTVEGGSFMM